MGESRVDGEPLALYEVPRTPAFDPLVTREVLGLSKGTGRLRYHALLVGNRKVFEASVLSLRDDPGMPEAFFKL